MENKKVVVNKIIALIPLSTAISLKLIFKHVYEIDDLDMPITFDRMLDSQTVLGRLGVNWKVLSINRCYIKDTVVRFKEIEDYTHYQTELNFKENESI